MPYNFNDLITFIAEHAVKPPLFEPGEPSFWDDPHISKSMLQTHLDPALDFASRRPEIINQEVQHLLSSGVLKPVDRVLDLGCGPGLYALRLAAKGLKVTGIDISESSIEYAIKQAAANNLNITYRCMNFFHIDYNAEFDVALQIYGEVGTFSDAKRDELFAKIHQVLRPGGTFVFDVTSPTPKTQEKQPNTWRIMEGGFWRPDKHLVLEQLFHYPENQVRLFQYIILHGNGATIYRIWTHDYTLETIKPVLEKAGFQIVRSWNDLTGTPYQAGGEWLAIAARKRY